MIEQTVTEKLLNLIKEKGIFSEYLPDNFNLNSDSINIYGAGLRIRIKWSHIHIS